MSRRVKSLFDAFSSREPVPTPHQVRSRLSLENALGRRHDLSGIEDVLRIERLLDGAHGVDGLGAKLGFEIFLLALPDAMLAGAGAAHRLRPLDQPMHELLAARHLFGILD